LFRPAPDEVEPLRISEGSPFHGKFRWSPVRRPYRVFGAILLIALAMLATIPGRGLRSHVARARFFASCARELKQITDFSVASHSQNLIRTLEERPHLIGVATWPYINGRWTTAQRFASLQAHYVELNQFPGLQIGTREQVQISDLGDIVPGLRIVIDRPSWFMREGELTLNLFKENLRAYSLAFTFGRVAGQRVLYVGCIQGRHVEGVEQLYRELTKKLHGLRPRDLMVSLAQMVGSAADASRIYLVSDAARVHRHPYFGDKAETLVSANYDDIWSEHRAVPGEGGFFELGTRLHQRQHQEIPSQKRAMYRRRYELMARLERDVKSLVAVDGVGTGSQRPQPRSGAEV
jgi:uncharacterized protein VirK/YbjX